MKIILKNIDLLNPYQKLNNKKIDLEIIDGIITDIGKNIKVNEDVKIFDLDGIVVVPGLFDMHVHLREPGREDKETVVSGCRSAARGGFTGIGCMPNTTPTIDSAEVMSSIKQKASDELTNVYIIAAATKNREGELLSSMFELVENGSVAFSDDGVAIKSAAILKRVMEYSKMFNVPIIEHCEDESLASGVVNEGIISTQLGLEPAPSISEYLIIMRDILMAEYINSKVHIAHISTKKGVQMVRDAKKRGVKVTAEVAPHHFTLDETKLLEYNTNYKMNPPLREKEDVEEIIRGLQDGTIDCIASDHAPHTIEDKNLPFELAPNGIIGLETEVGLTFNQLFHKQILSLEQIIEKLSINPRLILKIPVPQIKKGELANLTLLDINKSWTVNISEFFSKSVNSPFGGIKLKGNAIGVINNKKMFFNNNFFNI
ncbi:MAG: dihydroorotase [Bacteroidetes bacterium]|nr:dihydroorotase [Bacteroidota bacterium]